jgi:GT2 family glycosyltransferase
MNRPAVSIVVPSLGRPRELDRCVTALRQLRYRPFEIVLVACPAGSAAVGGHMGLPWLRLIPNRQTGIGEARNDGIAAAAGDIVAFIDDDAVPEPTWLDHLVEGIVATGAAAATGFVRGRNGISFQWRGRTIRPDAFTAELPDAGEAAYVPQEVAGVPMLEGTNMAIRRDILARVGGFDPAFRFYLDDADMALRLRKAGHRVAITLLAQVHHGFAASSRRRADRMPTDLYDVGRSLALFLRTHLGDAGTPEALSAHRDGERRRLLRYMVSGHGEPRDVGRGLAQFDRGVADGQRAQTGLPRDLGAPPAHACFREDPAGRSRVLQGRFWSRRALVSAGAKAAASGDTASLFVFSPTSLYHRVRFDAAGFWVQTGGLFGRAERTEPLLQFRSFAERCRQETARVAKVRGLHESLLDVSVE